MPSSQGGEARDADCHDHTAQHLFRHYGWYGGPITEDIFQEVKGIVEKFDVIVETEDMRGGTKKLANLLQERGWWDVDASFKFHGKMAKNSYSKMKKENENVLRMLEESNVWDRRLHTHIRTINMQHRHHSTMQ